MSLSNERKNTSLNPFPDVERDGTNTHWTDNKLRSLWLDLVKSINVLNIDYNICMGGCNTFKTKVFLLIGQFYCAYNQRSIY